MKRNYKIGDTTYSDITGISATDADTGNRVTLVDTSDATATASNIIAGYTAYVNGELITGISGGGNIDELMDNTLTTLASGATKVSAYKCYNMTSLTSVSLPVCTTIEDYGFYNCSAVATYTITDTVLNIGKYALYNFGAGTFDWVNANTDTPVSVDDYGLQSTRISSISGKWSLTGEGGLRDCTSLTSVDIDCSGVQIADYAFYNDTAITTLKLSNFAGAGNYAFSGGTAATSLSAISDFSITGGSTEYSGAIGNYAFYYLGYNRIDPSTNVLTVDMADTGVTGIGSYAFAYTQYMNFYMPNSLTSIGSYAFAYSSNQQIYLPYRTCPALSSTTAFTSNTTSKVFVNYNSYNSYRTATNWSNSTILSYLYAYAPSGTFAAGTELPTLNSEGYETTWYSDMDHTTAITTMPEISQDIYCTIGDTAAGESNVTAINVFNGTVIVTDGIKTYIAGDYIPVGTTLTVYFNPYSGYQYGYKITVNDTELFSEDTTTSLVGYSYEFTTVEDVNLYIVALFWNGTEIPVSTVFSENSWEQIKVGVDTGFAKDYWLVGDTKTTTYNGRTYSIRIVDVTYGDTDATKLSVGRYDKASGGKTHYVFEFASTIANTSSSTSQYNLAVNSSGKKYPETATSTYYTAGGWAYSDLYQSCYDGTLYEMLDAGIKNALSEIVLTEYAYPGTSSSILTTTSNNRLFLPAYLEIFDEGTSSYAPENNTGYTDLKQTVWDYYVEGTAATRQKYIDGSTYNGYYWLRTPRFGYTYIWLYVNSGSLHYNYANDSCGVAPCFAI